MRRIPPAARIVATVLFVVCVVATPSGAWWVYPADLGAVLVVAGLARVRPALLVRRARVEVPFLLFAALLPFVGRPPRVEVLGLALSRPGLDAGGAIAAKATLGVLAAVVLRATTTVPGLLAGLDRLRVPRAFTAIAGFMVRYLDVVVDDAARMRVARLARGDDPRWLWHARAVAATAGTSFVRAYERGERVHRAMLARGYDGSMPGLARTDRGSGRGWTLALLLPAAALAARLGLA